MIRYILITTTILILLFAIRNNKIYYTPFNIPGDQMAITIPPFGTFIESKYKKDKPILNHELAHWDQYKRMGFFGFYTTYILQYLKYGRKYNPMEYEARKLGKLKSPI
jgi:hypothetical protein